LSTRRQKLEQGDTTANQPKSEAIEAHSALSCRSLARTASVATGFFNQHKASVVLAKTHETSRPPKATDDSRCVMAFSSDLLSSSDVSAVIIPRKPCSAAVDAIVDDARQSPGTEAL